MNVLLLISIAVISSFNPILFDFNHKSDLSQWQVVDDGVMGGRSQGQFELNADGNAVFFGTVSLENNGGFSSVRYQFNTKDLSAYNSVSIHLKGDGKRYQFRIKSLSSDRHSYIKYFITTGEWQTVSIPLSDLSPSFRGMALDMPSFDGQKTEEIAFLIANKQAENFKLEIDQISFK